MTRDAAPAGDNPPTKSPGTGRPPGSRGDVTRARIIEAARTTFGAKGFGPATNKDIATVAGITPAAIYRYYPSKVALYLATVDDALAELEPAMREATEGLLSGRAQLVALADAAATIHEAKPYLAAFLSALPVEMQRHAEIAAAMTSEPDPISRLVAAAVERAEASGELADGVEPADVVAMVIACNVGLSLWASAIVPTASSAAMRAWSRLLVGGLFRGGD